MKSTGDALKNIDGQLGCTFDRQTPIANQQVVQAVQYLDSNPKSQPSSISSRIRN
jgi:hypothetical protein